MRPMILPYTDVPPSELHLMQARVSVRQEAERAQSECSAYTERLEALQQQQRGHMEGYNLFRKDMHAVSRELISSLASQSSAQLLRKRSRSVDTTAEGEALRFETLLTESLGLELQLLSCESGGAGGAVGASVALAALQSTQEVLRATRQRTEEINAMRCVEQQRCARFLLDRARLVSKRLEKIKALDGLLGAGKTRRNGSLLDSLE